MLSIWSDQITFPTFPVLKQDIKTDVLIIGGGIAGILCAYQLQQSGVKYALVEASTLCSGITKNTTAKITSQHGLIYHKLFKKFGAEKTKLYLEANEAAIREYAALSQSISCDFTKQDSFVYATDTTAQLKKELDVLVQLNFPARYVQNVPLPIQTTGAICFPNQAQFHPLKFLSALAKDLTVYEHTKVLSIENNTAITEHGNIHAKQIIVTTHFPFLNRHGSYFLKLYQHRSYVLALEHAQDVNGMYVDASKTGLSFRNYDNFLLLGGGSHRTGKHPKNHYSSVHPCNGFAELTAFANRYYPDAKIRYQFATQDCMPLDDVPYIGQYSKHTPNLYVATGFQKWGMTSAMTASLLLRDLILGRENPYAAVFSPSRTMLRTQLFINAGESTLNILNPLPRRCSHLGCALHWNAAEHSWDCPCHGSRFTEDGRVIDNPAKKEAWLRPFGTNNNKNI